MRDASSPLQKREIEVTVSNNTTKYVLTIDLGTSGPKVALVSTDGVVADYEFEETQLFLLPDGGAEQDPGEWWDSILRASKRLLEKGLVSADDIVAISCTSQWSGTVPVDSEGNHLMNAIIWMDSRGEPYIKRITGGLLKIQGYGILKLLRWLRLTGGIPAHSGKDSIAHIMYIKNELPDIYERTHTFLEPKDYINLRLTGRVATSYDAIALHWLTDNRDLSRVIYNDRLVKISTIDRAKLPDIKRPVDILGAIKAEVAHELGLNEGVRVVMGTPDVQSAAIGSGAVKDYEGHLYIGTSSWLTCHVPFKKTDILRNMASLPSGVPQKYFVANEQETAGACLNFLRDNILYHEDALETRHSQQDAYKLFDTITEKIPPGSSKVIFTPWLYGERTPVEDRSLRGGFYNLSLATTREHLIRAVFEGVAYNSRWLLGSVEKFIKRRFDAINMIGGGANSRVWCQIHADVLDRPIRQLKDPINANARGAAFLASVALGYISFDDISERIQIDNTYEPDPKNRKIYDELFKEFVNIYKRNNRMYARLNRESL
jgi:xylulokinase